MDSELERHSAKFDADVGAFIILCQKECKGQHFPNLDMLTALLTPHGATGVNAPSIEVVGGGCLGTVMICGDLPRTVYCYYLGFFSFFSYCISFCIYAIIIIVFYMQASLELCMLPSQAGWLSILRHCFKYCTVPFDSAILFNFSGDEAEDEEEEGEEEFDWSYQQKVPDENVVTAGHKYGFANNLTGVFTSLQVSCYFAD